MRFFREFGYCFYFIFCSCCCLCSQRGRGFPRPPWFLSRGTFLSSSGLNKYLSLFIGVDLGRKCLPGSMVHGLLVSASLWSLLPSSSSWVLGDILCLSFKRRNYSDSSERDKERCRNWLFIHSFGTVISVETCVDHLTVDILRWAGTDRCAHVVVT